MTNPSPLENSQDHSSPLLDSASLDAPLASDAFDPYNRLDQSIPTTTKDVNKPSGDLQHAFIGRNRPSRDITMVLPVELSAKIFLCCLPIPPSLETLQHGKPSETHRMLFKLGSVCQSWRTLAWLMPELWDTLIVDNLDREPAMPIAFIEDYLDRSGNRLLTISLTFQRNWSFYGYSLDQLKEMYLSDLLAAISKHVKRWKVLSLRVPQRFISAMEFDITNTTPQLSCLVLDGLNEPKDFNKPNPPLMRSSSSSILFTPSQLGLYGIHYEDLKISLKHLTHFDTGDINPLDFINILSIAPQLRSMSCDLDGDESDVMHCRSIVHQHLETLKWGYTYTDIDILQFLTLPALEHFECYRPVFEALEDLLRRSRCTLRQLLLDAPVMTYEELLELLDSTPEVHYLTLKYCSLTPDFFQRLWRQTSEPNGVPVFLPRLRTFHYTDLQIPRTDGLEWCFLAPAIRESPGLESQPRILTTLIFEASYSTTIDFSAQDLSLLRRLISNGIELRILDHQGTDVVSQGALLEEPTI